MRILRMCMCIITPECDTRIRARTAIANQVFLRPSSTFTTNNIFNLTVSPQASRCASYAPVQPLPLTIEFQHD